MLTPTGTNQQDNSKWPYKAWLIQEKFKTYKMLRDIKWLEIDILSEMWCYEKYQHVCKPKTPHPNHMHIGPIYQKNYCS